MAAANPEEANVADLDPLLLAAREGHVDDLRALLQQGVHPDAHRVPASRYKAMSVERHRR